MQFPAKKAHVENLIGAEVTWGLGQRFELYDEIGQIKVPDDYDHDVELIKFWEDFRRRSSYHIKVSDQAFTNKSGRMRPGERLLIHAYIVEKKSTFADCEEFIREKNGVLLGPNGLTMAYRRISSKYACWQRDCYSIDRVGSLPRISTCAFVPYLRKEPNDKSHFGFSKHTAGLKKGSLFFVFNRI